jgi:hypothetical protein
MSNNSKPIYTILDNYDKSYMRILFIALAIVGLLATLLLTSCKLFSEVEKSRTTAATDSAAVKKETETVSKVDTSKSKSESTYTKETIYFGRDTTINNYITTPGPTVIVRESGTKKEESQNYNFENRERIIVDSMRLAHLESQLTKQSETKVDVLGIGFWIGVALAGLVLIGLLIMAMKFKSQITSISNLITKKT